ncbi:MAG TPA: GDSL-type esterase/lipase family protein [Candidatus Angelobacter sp.]|nr:GDSL-type esterase/lipase family protein [Candidatus Angelobacter sp.]
MTNDTTPRNARILFIGDSVTACMTESVPGTCSSNPGLPLNPGQVGLNRAAGGQTTAEILARFQRDALDPQSWPDGATAHADVIVIEEHLNDYGLPTPRSLPLQKTEDNIRTMVDMALTANRSVVIQTMLPTASTHGNTDGPNAALGDFNGLYIKLFNHKFLRQEMSQKPHVAIADTYRAIVDSASCEADPLSAANCFAKPDLLEDGIHPSAAGFSAIFPVIREAIAKVVAAPTN